jgi:hypothetical protein
VRRDRSSDEQDCCKRDASSETGHHLTLINTRGVTIMLPLKCRRMVAPGSHWIKKRSKL